MQQQVARRAADVQQPRACGAGTAPGEKLPDQCDEHLVAFAHLLRIFRLLDVVVAQELLVGDVLAVAEVLAHKVLARRIAAKVSAKRKQRLSWSASACPGFLSSSWRMTSPAKSAAGLPLLLRHDAGADSAR